MLYVIFALSFIAGAAVPLIAHTLDSRQSDDRHREAVTTATVGLGFVRHYLDEDCPVLARAYAQATLRAIRRDLGHTADDDE